MNGLIQFVHTDLSEDFENSEKALEKNPGPLENSYILEQLHSMPENDEEMC